MALNFSYEFYYYRQPLISVGITSPATGRSTLVTALVDTGADISLFDLTVARNLALDLAATSRRIIAGIGGATTEARSIELELRLLDEPALSVTLPIAFAPILGLDVSNLVGLDVLRYFDVGLSHGRRTGYVGLTEAT